MSTSGDLESSGSRGTAGRGVDNQLSFNSELQEAYNKLELSEKRFRELYDKAPDMYHTLDLTGNFIEFNPKHTEILGYSFVELQDNHISCIMTEEMIPRLGEDFATLMGPGHVNGREYILRKKDGSLMTVEVHAMRFDDSEGEPREIRCIMRDITERKKLEDQLLQAQKMESIGQLAGGIAHDFNNLLTAIQGYSQMALSSSDDPPRVQEYLRQIQTASERASNLTRQLLGFSRRQIISPRPTNVNDVINDVEQMLSHLATENVELRTSLADDLHLVNIDPAQVEQVLINLVVNARDAMPTGGELTIRTSNVSFVDPQANDLLDMPAGEYVSIAVSDTGVGMTTDVQSRIFEPFFTTKGEGEGTGLGLSMCYGIAKQNGGLIEARSLLGQGTTVNMYIPRIEAEPASEGQETQTAEVSQGTGTVLLVEDDPLVRRLGAAVLSQQGYQVVEAANGQEALQLAEAHGGEIHLLLTDVVMPGTNILELTDRIKQARPNIKILYTSGYTDEEVIRRGILESEVEFLAKPYSPTDLLQRVQQALGS